MAIKTFDRPTLKLMQQAITVVLNSTVGKDFGVNFNIHGGSFLDKNATIKLEISVLDASGADATGAVVDPQREEFKRSAKLVGLKPEWLGTTYKDYGGEYRIVGLDLKKRKNCVLIENTRTGKDYITSPEAVLDGKRLAGEAPAEPKRPPMVNHAAIERQIAKMKRDNPEAYYADGEFRAAGMTEKQIHDRHYTMIERQMRAAAEGKTPLFGFRGFRKDRA